MKKSHHSFPLVFTANSLELWIRGALGQVMCPELQRFERML